MHSHTQITKKTFFIVIINALLIVVEFIMANVSNSTAMLADAWHNLLDVIGLIFVFVSSFLVYKQSAERFTFGYKPLTIVSVFVNVLLVLVGVVLILYEVVEKIFFMHNFESQGLDIVWVGLVASVINGLSAWAFLKDSQHDLNAKGAYIHLITDTGGSVAVVITGIVITLTGWMWVDPFVGFLLAVLIFITCWPLLKQLSIIMMKGIPVSVNANKLKQFILSNKTVQSIHEMHIWNISANDMILTVHIVLVPQYSLENIKLSKQLHDEIKKQFGFSYVTIQIEPPKT